MVTLVRYLKCFFTVLYLTLAFETSLAVIFQVMLSVHACFRASSHSY